MTGDRGVLAVQAAGLEFQNPVILAAGTAAYGEELADVVKLDTLGGLVTKAVSPEPRAGAPAPRVAEFNGGMINAVGLANPGVAAVVRDHLPWLSRSLPHVRKLANVVGFAIEEFGDLGQAEADAHLRGRRDADRGAGSGEDVHFFRRGVDSVDDLQAVEDVAELLQRDDMAVVEFCGIEMDRDRQP